MQCLTVHKRVAFGRIGNKLQKMSCRACAYIEDVSTINNILRHMIKRILDLTLWNKWSVSRLKFWCSYSVAIIVRCSETTTCKHSNHQSQHHGWQQEQYLSHFSNYIKLNFHFHICYKVSPLLIKAQKIRRKNGLH